VKVDLFDTQFIEKDSVNVKDQDDEYVVMETFQSKALNICMKRTATIHLNAECYGVLTIEPQSIDFGPVAASRYVCICP